MFTFDLSDRSLALCPGHLRENKAVNCGFRAVLLTYVADQRVLLEVRFLAEDALEVAALFNAARAPWLE